MRGVYADQSIDLGIIFLKLKGALPLGGSRRHSNYIKGESMIVNVPTKIIPVWFIERWKKENAEPGSSLDIFIEQMIKDWELEEIRQSEIN